jgi:hypothetical protein
MRYLRAYWSYLTTLSNPGRFLWLTLMAILTMVLIIINKYIFEDSEVGVFISLLPVIIISVPIRMSTISPSSRARKD